MESVLSHIVHGLIDLLHFSEGLYQVLVRKVRDADVFLSQKAGAVVQFFFLLLSRDLDRLFNRLLFGSGFHAVLAWNVSKLFGSLGDGAASSRTGRAESSGGKVIEH